MGILDIEGARLAFDIRGHGPSVVFVHGTGTHRLTFGPVLDALPVGGALVTYDRRGFGESRGSLAQRMADHAGDLAALIEHLESGPSTVVAQSGGAVVALQLAARQPELVRHLVLAEPVVQLPRILSLAPVGAVAAVQARRIVGGKENAVVGFYRWASRRSDGTNSYDLSPDEWRQLAVQHADAVFRELRQMMIPVPSTRVIRSVACPVTVVIGDIGQPVFHRTTRRMARLLPESTTVRIADAGHLIAMDQPVSFASVVADVLAA